MKTIHVKLKIGTHTPLEDVVTTGESGVWRIRDEEAVTLKRIVIWDERTERKCKAQITGVEKIKGGYVIKFNPTNSDLYDVFWANRPKFNRTGYAIL